MSCSRTARILDSFTRLDVSHQFRIPVHVEAGKIILQASARDKSIPRGNHVLTTSNDTLYPFTVPTFSYTELRNLRVPQDG